MSVEPSSLVTGGYHGPPPAGASPGSLQWLLDEAEVGWNEPPEAQPEEVKKEDLDLLVQKCMVQRLSERVHLRRRVEVIHKGGAPEAQESCAALSRGCWALPLFSCAVGIQSVSQPIRVCLSESMQQCSRSEGEGSSR
ncbi:Kynurenine--oxoglutarate transaminase 3 [Durusdinium trenchii]|uniref:Kynurenine--oxoglutarate transaminase 3 n=1 Tax=Durusdinium trenchii TaxID=1381693 RepID=A0ABP0RXE3_9DINO